jgi:hypothetical protein
MAALNTTMRGAAGRRSAAGVPRFTNENPMHGQADPEENVRRSMRTDPEFLERPRTAGGQTDVRLCPFAHLCSLRRCAASSLAGGTLTEKRAGEKPSGLGALACPSLAQHLLAMMPPLDKQNSLTRGGAGVGGGRRSAGGRPPLHTAHMWE